MCDTICVLKNESKNGVVMLAKNSDRDPNEPHVIRFVPAGKHEAGGMLKCTYIEIPQAQSTNAVLLYKPSWIWGAEMGVNEHGVAIGNEAVFTKAKKGPDTLTGMDLLRLALERADTAKAALEIIITLIKDFGQGGNCGYSHDFRYDNSFLIADKTSAFILETSGRNYAAEPVIGKAAISNRLFMRGEHVLREGIKEGEDFAKRFTEPVFSFFSKAKHRRAQSLCAVENGPVSPKHLMDALRTHEPGLDGHEFLQGSVGSVCMHAGGLIGDHTTGSFVAVLREDGPMTIWSTGASTPCISAFKPVFFGIDAPPVFYDELEGKQYWLKREKLHRAALAGLVDINALRSRRDELEQKWIAEEEALLKNGVPNNKLLRAFAMRAAAEEQELIDEFSVENWDDIKGSKRFSKYWRDKNAKLGE